MENRLPSQAYVIPGVKVLRYNDQDIINDVCTYFNTTYDKIKSKSREQNHVRCRQLCMYFLRRTKKTLTTTACGELFNRDHSTTIHSCKTVANEIATNKLFREMVQDIERIINQKTSQRQEEAVN